ncbi:hypothetical protein ROHU_031451 [Labeo rohita]|uniref:Uncharacterized protein n=1 Tax=Labeo rohita TaxID=84645 RepID=A0A498LLU2_LABRO|nr:hypothetical protein ROHU_031451 [Labeo rohita]
MNGGVHTRSTGDKLRRHEVCPDPENLLNTDVFNPTFEDFRTLVCLEIHFHNSNDKETEAEQDRTVFSLTLIISVAQGRVPEWRVLRSYPDVFGVTDGDEESRDSLYNSQSAAAVGG